MKGNTRKGIVLGPLFCLLLVNFLAGSEAKGQRIAIFRTTTTGKEKFSIPMQAELDPITALGDSSLQLVEIQKDKKLPVPFQVAATENGRRMYWLIEPRATTSRVFELVQVPPQKSLSAMQALKRNGALILSDNGRELLQYHFETVYPPKGIDTAYKRSGFIHPLNTPSGQALTRINAPDHYHHWGLWNPWTHVLFEDEVVDFWNLKDRKGTVRFAGFNKIETGAVYSGFSALHEHVVFKKNGTEKTAVNEVQTVKIYKASPGAAYYLMDITSQLSCAGNSAVRLLEYRYGGLGIRATEQWNDKNSTTLTSEGKDRKSADGSNARWCLTQGTLGAASGGLEMMSHPANYNHPEPLRVWPENMNGRGDVFLNFSPTKNKDWLLEPGKTYLLKYRFLIFNNKLSAAEAEEGWRSFAHPPQLHIQK